MNRSTMNTTEGNAFYVLGLAVGGALTGVMAGTGAVLLGFGAHQYKQSAF